MGPTWGPPGSYRPQMGPMLAPWTLLSGNHRGISSTCWVASRFSGFILSRVDGINFRQMFLSLWYKSSTVEKVIGHGWYIIGMALTVSHHQWWMNFKPVLVRSCQSPGIALASLLGSHDMIHDFSLFCGCTWKSNQRKSIHYSSITQTWFMLCALMSFKTINSC